MTQEPEVLFEFWWYPENAPALPEASADHHIRTVSTLLPEVPVSRVRAVVFALVRALNRAPGQPETQPYERWKGHGPAETCFGPARVRLLVRDYKGKPSLQIWADREGK